MIQLTEHSDILKEHSRILDEHSKILDEHSGKLDSLTAEMIEVRQTGSDTYELLQLVAEKVGLDIPQKKQ